MTALNGARRPTIGGIVGPQPAVQVRRLEPVLVSSTATGCRRARRGAGTTCRRASARASAARPRSSSATSRAGAVGPLVAEVGGRSASRISMSSRASPGGSSALRHALHSALGVGDRAFALAPRRRSGQHDVGELGGLGEEDVLHDQMIEVPRAAGSSGRLSASDWAGFSPITYSRLERRRRSMASNISVRCQPFSGRDRGRPRLASNLLARHRVADVLEAGQLGSGSRPCRRRPARCSGRATG